MNQSELHNIIENIKPIDKTWVEKARLRTAQLVMPSRALGRLHDISERLCAIQEILEPSLKRKTILVFAGDHGVADEGVSAYPQEITGAMVQTFLKNGAGINAISRQVGAEVLVVDMGIIPELNPGSLDGGERLLIHKISPGTKNLSKEPAMSRQAAVKAIMTGFQIAANLFEQASEGCIPHQSIHV